MRRFIFGVFILVGIAAIFASAPRGEMARAQGYGPDLTTTSAAIDCGHDPVSSAANAFDDNWNTNWISSQTGDGVIGVACIGQDFGENTYEIRYISIKQNKSAGRDISVTFVQNSTNGTTWNTVQEIDGLPHDDNVHWYPIVASVPMRYWRLLAGSAPSNPTANWGAIEIEMMELIEWPTDTPGPSSTPTITLTPSTTPTSTTTNTPEGLSLGTLATVGYPISVKPTGDFGQMSIVVVLLAILGQSFVIIIIAIIAGRRAGIW